jgi:CheY-like chemotaxis protein
MNGDQAQRPGAPTASQNARAAAVSAKADNLVAQGNALITRLKRLIARLQQNRRQVDELLAARKDARAQGRKGANGRSFETAKQVLVVDDDACSRYALTRFLLGSRLDCRAVERSEALRCLAFSSFDLIITHMHKPGVEGDRLAEEIKRRKPTIPVVLITATPPQTLPPGIDRVLVKTFTLDELSETVAALLTK